MSFDLLGKGVGFNEPFSAANFDHCLSFTRGEILRAALLTGRSLRHHSRADEFARNENRWRLAAARLALDLGSIPGTAINFRRSPDWHRLDPSERGALNYSLGGIVTKLVAERLLQAPLMLHHDVYRQFLRSSRRSRDERPDFVAWSRHVGHRWLALEAKGRQRSPTSAAKTKAKDQARGLGSVRGVAVSCHAVCWTWESRGTVRFLFEDPPPKYRGDNLEMGLPELAAEYYQPVLPFVRSSVADSKREGVVIFRVPELDLALAVEEHIAGILQAEHPEEAARFLVQLDAGALVGDEPLGLDGLAVMAGDSW